MILDKLYSDNNIAVNGQRKKEFATLNGRSCIIKTLSLTEICSEYSAYKVAKAIGVPVADCCIGGTSEGWKFASYLTGTVKSATQIIKDAGYPQFDFRLCGGGNFSYDYDELARVLGAYNKYNWELMNIFDVLVSNGDRHAENFGTIANYLSPSYDHNLCFSVVCDSEYSMVHVGSKADVSLLDLAEHLIKKNYELINHTVNLATEIKRTLFSDLERVVGKLEVEEMWDCLQQNISLVKQLTKSVPNMNLFSK